MADDNDNFKPVLFIGEDPNPVPIDANARYVFNRDGHTEHTVEPQSNPIPMTPEDPVLSLGHRYANITWQDRTINPGQQWEYVLKEFDFHTAPHPVVYDPMWATTFTCQAFGITLLKPGQSVYFHYEKLVRGKYTYGAFAGYQSPYIGNSRQLLTVNATDLEYHAFPHIFSSQDATIPLVISVARWRPRAREIYLADLWVKPGDCLIIPPKFCKDDSDCDSIDMHGNRNSAFACWGVEGRYDLATETTLGNDELFDGALTKPHYHSEKSATVHTRPAPAEV